MSFDTQNEFIMSPFDGGWLTPPIIEMITHVTRFYQLWSMLPSFRDEYKVNPQKAIQPYNLKLTDDVIRFLIDNEYARDCLAKGRDGIPGMIRAMRRFNRAKLLWRNEVRTNCAPVNPAFKKWRERQMNRAVLEFGPFQEECLIHTPIIFELQKGCSVQCDFCAIRAPKLQGIFRYNDENAALWKSILLSSKKIVGDALRHGVCYFATEPFDNPDYEKFCMDYAAIAGAFPQTTTAVATRNIERTRNLVNLSHLKGNMIDRLSLLTIDDFLKVINNFTPEETLWIEMLPQMPEALGAKAISGRLLEKTIDDPSIIEREAKKTLEENRLALSDSEFTKNINKLVTFSVSCLTGFVVNLVDRKIKLVAPCNADKDRIDGYIVFDEKEFDSADSFEKTITDMINSNMDISVNNLKSAKFLPGAKLVETDSGFVVETFKATKKFESVNNNNYVKEIARHIESGTRSISQIAFLLEMKYGVAQHVTVATLEYFFKEGIIDDSILNRIEPIISSEMITL